MHTRDDVRDELASLAPPTGRLFEGIGRTALVAAYALTGCALLVTVGAVLSVCWMIHPVLTLPAMVGLLWVIARLAGYIFYTGSNAHRQ